VNRRLVGLLAAFCLLSACTEEPVDKIEPIARPRGEPITAAPPAQAPTPPAPVDPSKVLLRWKLDAPTAFQLTLSAPGAAPSAAPEPTPPAASKKKTRVKKSRKRAASPTPEESASAQSVTFFLLRGSTPTEGALPFALIPETPAGETQQGTMSERGFVLEGLSGAARNLAVMVLELPADPVGPGTAWPLTTDLVNVSDLPSGFRLKDTRQKSEVKLTALTPTAEGEQVATLEYELFESVSGQQGRTKRTKRGHSHEHENTPVSVKKSARGRSAAAKAPESLPTFSAEVRVIGRGEFLVKAGRWRSWEATITTRTDGLTLPGMPAGERVLRLTPVEPVPAELLQRQAKK